MLIIREARKPKWWGSRFAAKVILAYKDGKLSYDNIGEWEKKQNSGTVPHPSLGSKEILDYYLATKQEPPYLVDCDADEIKWLKKGI